MNPEFWKGKRVYLTGHTGFKGGWTAMWLHSMGATVVGYALEPEGSPCLFDVAKVGDHLTSHIGDIRDLEKVKKTMSEAAPDIVIHMAAQPLVRESYKTPRETYEVNVMGSINVLEAARGVESVKVVVNITTDKVYAKLEGPWGYREIDPVGGNDPYASSKACSELVTHCYRKSFAEDAGFGLASVRAGNVIGGGDWAVDRIIPDTVRSFAAGKPVEIRNPAAVRPWQFVLEPVRGYLQVAERLWDDPQGCDESWNFGPLEEAAQPVSWIVEKMVNYWGTGAKWERDHGDHPAEDAFLRLDSSKARWSLGWEPEVGLELCLEWLVDWYKSHYAGEDMEAVTLKQISDYQHLVMSKS